MCLNWFKPSTDGAYNLAAAANAQTKAADDAAAAAEQQQLQQQQQIAADAQTKADAAVAATKSNVTQDTNEVDKSFKQFDPKYYNGYRDAYTGYYAPQIADQYSQAQDQLTAALAGNGTLESSVGAQALANLAKRNTDQVATVQGQADSAVNDLKSKVSDQKTALLNQANASVDPTQIAGTAQATTTALAAPMSYTPLSSVFSDLVTPFSNYTKSAANAPVAGIPLVAATTPNAYLGAGQAPASPY